MIEYTLKNTQEQFRKDSIPKLILAIRTTILFIAILFTIFIIEDYFSYPDQFYELLSAKLMTIVYLILLLYLFHTKYLERYAEYIYLLNYFILMLSTLFQGYITKDPFLMQLFPVVGTFITAALVPLSIRYIVIVIIISISGAMINLFLIKGEPHLPLNRAEVASFVLSGASIFLAFYNYKQRFKLWQAQTTLSESEEQFRQLAEFSKDIVWIWSPDRKIQYISPAYEYYTGFSPDFLYKKPYRVLKTVHPDDKKKFGTALERILSGNFAKLDLRVIHTNGQLFYLEGWGNPIKNSSGKIIRYIGVWRDVTEKIKLMHSWEKKASTDPLTKIYNMRFFYEIADRHLENIKRFQIPLSLIIFDIDYFKNINDTYGHQSGDNVINEIVSICQEIIRDEDILARYGGEEFVILLPNTDIENAKKTAERIRKKIESSKFNLKEKVTEVTISLGLTTYDQNQPVNIKELIQQADEALYESKNNGRNRTTLWGS